MLYDFLNDIRYIYRLILSNVRIMEICIAMNNIFKIIISKYRNQRGNADVIVNRILHYLIAKMNLKIMSLFRIAAYKCESG